MVEAWDRIFDPGIVGLRHNGTKSPRSPASGCEESLHYALALLEMAERSRQGRAEAIINRLLDSPRPPAAGALTLSLIWHRHRRRLPASLIEKITVSLGKAAHRIRSSDTSSQPDHPSRAINEIFVLLSAARILDDEALRSCAIDRFDALAKLACLTARAPRGAAARDLAVALAGLRAIDSYIDNSGISAQMGNALLHLQNESLPALHPARQATPGKSPGTDLLDLLVGSAIRGILGGSPDSGHRTFAALYACVMKIESPSPLFPDSAAISAR